MGWVVTTAIRFVAATLAMVSALVAAGTKTVAVARSSSDLQTDSTATRRISSRIDRADDDANARFHALAQPRVHLIPLIMNYLRKFSDPCSELLATQGFAGL